MRPTILTLTRVIHAPREKVFAAWMSPDALRVWWGPGPVTCPGAEVDFREGGVYRIANDTPEGMVWISGRFVRIRNPEEITYSWSATNVPGEPTFVRVTFAPHPDGTELKIVHERFADEAIRDMHLGGWEGCLDKLEAYFAA